MGINTEQQVSEQDPNDKLKAEYVDEREDKSAWFLEVKERAKLSPANCVEHYAPNKAAMALWLAAQGARITDIQKKTGLGRETIRGLQWRHNDTLETKRKEFSMRYAIAAHCQEGIFNLLSSNVVNIAWKVINDNRFLGWPSSLSRFFCYFFHNQYPPDP